MAVPDASAARAVGASSRATGYAGLVLVQLRRVGHRGGREPQSSGARTCDVVDTPLRAVRGPQPDGSSPGASSLSWGDGNA